PLNEENLRWLGLLQDVVTLLVQADCPRTVLVLIPDGREVILGEDLLVVDRYLRAEWRVGDDHVDRGERNGLVQLRRPLVRVLERVGLEQAAGAVVIHDHVHLRGSHERRIQVDAENTLTEVLVATTVELCLLVLRALGWVLPLAALGLLDVFERVVHARDEEATGVARRVEDAFIGLRVEHRYGHAACVARGEKFAAVAAQVRSDDLLIRDSLYIDGRA